MEKIQKNGKDKPKRAPYPMISNFVYVTTYLERISNHSIPLSLEDFEWTTNFVDIFNIIEMIC